MTFRCWAVFAGLTVKQTGFICPEAMGRGNVRQICEAFPSTSHTKTGCLSFIIWALLKLYPEEQTIQVWSCQSFVTVLAGATQVQRTSFRGDLDSPKANLSFGVMSVQSHQMNHSPGFYPENY